MELVETHVAVNAEAKEFVFRHSDVCGIEPRHQFIAADVGEGAKAAFGEPARGPHKEIRVELAGVSHTRRLRQIDHGLVVPTLHHRG